MIEFLNERKIGFWGKGFVNQYLFSMRISYARNLEMVKCCIHYGCEI